MNKNHHIANQAELERLIGRYFNGETSVQEEQLLRETLAHCPWSSEAIDDSRMVVGYFAAHCREQKRTFKKISRRQMIGIAASTALIIGVGILALWHPSVENNSMCVAYVNGKTVNNDETVMAMIESDLNEMGDASMGITAQLSSMSEAIELDNE